MSKTNNQNAGYGLIAPVGIRVMSPMPTMSLRNMRPGLEQPLIGGPVLNPNVFAKMAAASSPIITIPRYGHRLPYGLPYRYPASRYHRITPFPYKYKYRWYDRPDLPKYRSYYEKYYRDYCDIEIKITGDGIDTKFIICMPDNIDVLKDVMSYLKEINEHGATSPKTETDDKKKYREFTIKSSPYDRSITINTTYEKLKDHIYDIPDKVKWREIVVLKKHGKTGYHEKKYSGYMKEHYKDLLHDLYDYLLRKHRYWW